MKVKSPSDLLKWRWQTDQSVAVVTGTFDIFQPGNLYALEQARLLADRVIVVVEPDELVARHGSPGRPQNKLETRVEMVAHLRDVAAVTTLSQGDAAAFFDGINPFQWVTSGGQRTADPYARTLETVAARVMELEPIRGCFTEEIIAAIAAQQTPIKIPTPAAPGRGSANLGQGAFPPSGVVTVNGCFDILHIGHLRFLAEARAMGDSLTVLINSDVSVARYKGPTRPIFPETFRAAALKALDSVSEVRVFQGDTPLDEMRRLRPQIHVKGGSYEPDRVRTERELVESWGGQLVCTPMVEGFSTTEYIRKALGVRG